MGEEENRVHARIHVSTKIDVAGPDGMIECELKDVSKGGARFFSPSSVGLIGETVELFLPGIDGSDIAVMAQIIRNELAGDGRMVAVRFDAVEPAMARALSDLIELLLSTTNAGARTHQRAARRIEIRFGTLGELHGILQDIADGGLLMTIAEPLSLYEDVDVIVPDLGGAELLTLHGRVTHQRKAAKGDAVAYQVGLEFREMRPESRACVLALIGHIDEAGEPEEDAPKDPEGAPEGDATST
jgi:c-di-GMP-binding flagellar brake protein YcgR